MNKNLEQARFISSVIKRNPGEKIFHQAIKDVTIKKQNVEARLVQERQTLFDAKLYRDELKINDDYTVLIKKEKAFGSEKLQEIVLFKTQRLNEHKKVYKDTNLWIKQAIKPYRKYIRYASRGLNAEKKELTRKNRRVLKKSLNEVKDNLNITL